MAFEKRRELLFVYSVKDANPNGDPLNANAPRKDEETGQILVSDVRIKRTIRDQWLREKKNVFVDGEAQTLTERVEILKKNLNVSSGKEALAQCIDTRLFGVTFALPGKESFSWCGPVQFKWGRSLHRTKEQFIQGTAAFARKDDSAQRSFRNEYIVPFCVIAVYGIANQHASYETSATTADLNDLSKALWNGTSNLISRSKVGHVPLALFEVTYVAGFDGSIGALDERVRLVDKDGKVLEDEAQLALRSIDTVLLDIASLGNSIIAKASHVESVRIIRDERLHVAGKDRLAETLGGKLSEETR